MSDTFTPQSVHTSTTAGDRDGLAEECAQRSAGAIAHPAVSAKPGDLTAAQTGPWRVAWNTTWDFSASCP